MALPGRCGSIKTTENGFSKRAGRRGPGKFYECSGPRAEIPIKRRVDLSFHYSFRGISVLLAAALSTSGILAQSNPQATKPAETTPVAPTNSDKTQTPD